MWEIAIFCYPHRNTWYTSGVIDEETMRMKWEGDGTVIEAGTRFWRSDDDRNKPGDHIVYTYGGKIIAPCSWLSKTSFEDTTRVIKSRKLKDRQNHG